MTTPSDYGQWKSFAEIGVATFYVIIPAPRSEKAHTRPLIVAIDAAVSRSRPWAHEGLRPSWK